MEKATLTDREKYPEVYRAVEPHHVDWRTRKRTVPMRVLALGMPRTATASLWTALRQLGYTDTHHMLNVIANPTDCDRWAEAARRKSAGLPPFTVAEWDALLGDCQAVCDAPSMAFAPELIAAYPSARVILSTRPVDAWYASCLSTIAAPYSPLLTRVLSYTDPAFFGRWKPMIDALWLVLWKGDFRQNGKQAFLDHYAEIRALVPKDRLLEFEPKMGWRPLCAFLGEDVPEGVYPRVNDTEAFATRQKLMIEEGVRRSVRNGVVVLGTAMIVAYTGFLAFRMGHFWRKW